MITISNTRFSFRDTFLINIGILCILNFIFLNSYSNFDLNNTEKVIIVTTNILLMISSLIIHEIGHLIGSIITRIRIKQVIMSSFGGQITLDQDDGTSYKNKILLFFSGPLTSITVGLSLILTWQYYSELDFQIFPIKETLENSLALIGVYNVIIGVANLFPTLPFDCGILIESHFKKSKKNQNGFANTIFKFWNKGVYLLVGTFIVFLTISTEQYTLLVLLIYLMLLHQDVKDIHSNNYDSPISDI